MTKKFSDENRRHEADKSADPLEYATGYHAPVLCNTVIELLITDTSGIYVDCTLGGGGHTHALLDTLAPDALVVGIDRDPDAIQTASQRLASEIKANRLRVEQGNFSDVDDILSRLKIDRIDGILMDFGVSSHQLNEAARGFSHREAGALDMRMGEDATVSAEEIVNTWEHGELARIFRKYGEEPMASRIANDIIAARPVLDTEALAMIIRNRVKGPRASKTLARVFQALRIQVNDELGAIEEALVAATTLVRAGGRCVAMSYHSLEDRLVKRYFRTGNFEGEPSKDFYGNIIAPWRPITNRPVTANDDEIEANPRARSVRLRAAERLGDFDPETTRLSP